MLCGSLLADWSVEGSENGYIFIIVMISCIVIDWQNNLAAHVAATLDCMCNARIRFLNCHVYKLHFVAL